MRAAILIGVSEYDNESKLPGCDKDLEAIAAILEVSKRYDEVFVSNKHATAEKLKGDLASFFADLKGNSIDELFFYFTGHGLYQDEEFYYILTDFERSRRRLTSLENSEVDNWIKSVNAKLVIKVIDACQSGVVYIKGNEPENIERYYKSTANSFKNCYFMHSCSSNQFSYQDEELSFFTRSFLKAIRDSEKQEIRFKHIIDYISDEFQAITEQTPFFVTQADYTEVFIAATAEVKEVIERYIVAPEVNDDTKGNHDVSAPKKLLDLIKTDASRFISEKEAEQVLLGVKKTLEELTMEKELSELYEKTILEARISELPKKNHIGTWLRENPKYFAEPEYRDVAYQTEVPQFPLWMSSGFTSETKTVTKYRKEVEGYKVTADIPFKALIVNLVPKFPNLSQYAWLLAFIVSKKDLKIFHSFSTYDEIDWNKKSLNDGINWVSRDFLFKDEKSITQFLRDEFSSFSDVVLIAVKRKFVADDK